MQLRGLGVRRDAASAVKIRRTPARTDTGTKTALGLVACGDEPDALQAICAPLCKLAIWRRQPATRLSSLADLDPNGIDDIVTTVGVGDLEVHLALLVRAAGYPASIRSPLSRDVASLGQLYARTGEWRTLTLRLEWIETDACRRFHMDAIATRLLTTYVGRGTQWKHADDDTINELSPGDVAILKGRLLSPDAPILHRSPPIMAEAGRRLLLTIDGLSNI